MMRIMVKKAISLILIIELITIVSYLYSFEFFINLQVAFASSLFIILGSSFAYRKMVQTQVQNENFVDQKELLDNIEDPYELYDKVNDEVREDTLGCEKPKDEADAEDLDLKTIVKEEKAKIKTLSLKSMKHGVRGSVSLFRLVPYLFLVLGFIALKNNDLLNIAIYLPSILLGIIVGSVVAKELSS